MGMGGRTICSSFGGKVKGKWKRTRLRKGLALPRLKGGNGLGGSRQMETNLTRRIIIIIIGGESAGIDIF